MSKPPFTWELREIQAYLLVAVLFSLILTFTNWGTDAVDLALGFGNWILGFVIVVVSLLVHDIGHRWMAKRQGYKTEFKINWLTLALSVLLCIVSNGRAQVFLGGGMALSLISHARLGKFGYRRTLKHEGLIGVSGPLASLALAGLVKSISLAIGLGGFFVDELVAFNVLYAAYTMIPVPPFDGFKVLWWSRLWWVFSAGFVVGFMFLALAGIISLALSLVVGLAFFLTFIWVIEPGLESA